MLLLDLSNFLHRALHAMNTEEKQLTSLDGQVTSGLHLVLNMLNSEMRKLDYDDEVLAFWDSGIPAFRRRIYRNYKYWKEFKLVDGFSPEDALLSDYNKMSEDEKSVFMDTDRSFLDNYTFSRKVLHEDILPSLGIRSVKAPNTEADDFIAYVCYLLVKNNYPKKILIISSDNDYKQLLLEDKIEIYNPITKTLHTENDFYTSFNDIDVNSKNWRDLFLKSKALRGDSSDNVPALKGIGNTSAWTYAKMMVCGGIAQKDLPRCARGNKDAHQYLVSQEGINDLERNLKLIDMTYFIDNEKEYTEYLDRYLLNTKLVRPNPELAQDILQKYQLTKMSLLVDDIVEAMLNTNSDFLYNILLNKNK